MTKNISNEQAKEKFVKLQLKIQKAVLAMDDAKRTFNKLKYFDHTTSYDTTPQWAAVCKAAGINESSEFDDLIC